MISLFLLGFAQQQPNTDVLVKAGQDFLAKITSDPSSAPQAQREFFQVQQDWVSQANQASGVNDPEAIPAEPQTPSASANGDPVESPPNDATVDATPSETPSDAPPEEPQSPSSEETSVPTEIEESNKKSTVNSSSGVVESFLTILAIAFY